MTTGPSPQQAVSLTLEQALHKALTHHQTGQLQDAELLYRAILQAWPTHPDANHNLGVLAMQVKQPAGALPHFKAALEANPNQGQYWVSYIDALIQTDQIDVARQVLEHGRQRGLQGKAVEVLAEGLVGGARVADHSNAKYQHASKKSLPVSSAVPKRGKKKLKTKPVPPDRSAGKSALHQEGNPSPQEINTLMALFAEGRYPEAATRAKTMTMHFPQHMFGWKLLGAVLQQMGRSAEALAPMQQAVLLAPNDAEAHCNLGSTLQSLGRLDDAVASYCRALEIRPDFADAHINLGNAFYDMRQFHEAETSFRRVLQIKPDYAEVYGNLGNTFKGMGRLDKAEASYRRALEIKPDYADAHSNLGVTLQNLGQLHDAVGSYRRALEIKPDFAEAHSNLGVSLQLLGQLHDAVDSYRRALEINPDFAEAHGNLGATLQNLGQLDDAAASYRRALEINPDFAEAHSGLLFCLSHDETVTPDTLFAAHVTFGERFESIGNEHRLSHGNTREPFRRLRLGFVSGDLRSHAVANFIEPVWAALDPEQVEVCVYSNYPTEDQVTERLRALSHHWHKVAGWRDADLAAQICADRIDILFDLSGHTAHNRLLTFALKPAPIQVTWIGYPNTTGLRAMDYVLCDLFNAPHGLYEHFYVEKFARLPCSGTFAPEAGAPSLNALPALGNGHVTFGSFNRVSKLGDQVIGAWSQVLKAVPGSHLLLGNVSDPALAQQLTERFGRHGIAAERLAFRPKVSLHDYLALHHEVDIILDTWPYTGGTTTNHALWMGVPVVTLAGPSRSQCQSAAVLGRLGLKGWVARDVEEFVRLAVHWANSPEELARLRSGMRERWQASPLRQPAAVARGLEKAVRVMWQRWCAGLPAEHFEIDPDVVFDSTGLN